MANYLRFLGILLFSSTLSLTLASLEQDISYSNLMKTVQRRVENELKKTSTLREIRPVLEAIEDLDRRRLLRQANKYFSDKHFDLSAESANFDVSAQCLNHTKWLISAILQRETWAIRMLDAMGKIPSDVLEGNLAWYGSYDECVKVKAIATNNYTGLNRQESFQGKYCQVSIAIPNPDKNIANMGAFAALRIGMCFPDSCSTSDTLALANTALSFIRLHNTSLAAYTSNCQENELPYDTKAIAVLVICGLYITLLALATLFDLVVIQLPKQRQKMEVHKVTINENGDVTSNIDYKHNPDEERKPLLQGKSKMVAGTSEKGPTVFGKIMLAFSIYTNGKKLLSTYQSPDSIKSIHGIRFLSMTWVILCHTFVFSISFAGNLGTFLPKLADRWTFQAIANAYVSVDSFFTLSGLLMAYLLLKEMKRNDGKINWAMFYFHRFWRLTPPYMLVLMVYTTLTWYISSGPVWPQSALDQCEDDWWTNLLYINNLVKPEKCFAWAWYLANDMQFFAVSPLLIIPLFYSELIGVIVCLVVLLGLCITSGVVSIVDKLPPSPFGGAINADAGAYNDDYYIKPYTRMSPYVVGILAGYILYKTQCRLKLNKFLNCFGWVVATVLACVVLYGLYDPLNGRNMLSLEVSALYNATHKVVWGACVCWVIFACVTDNGGFVDTILSWRGIVPLSRLTYCAYLVHPIVMYVYLGSIRQPILFTDTTIVWLFLGNLVASYGVAFVVSLAFESPMMGLEKVIFRRGEKKAS